MKRKIVLTLAGLFCATALLSIGLVSATATSNQQAPISDEAAYKLAHDTDPHIPLTPAQEKALALKEQLVADFMSGKILGAEALARSQEIKAQIADIPPAISETKTAELVPGG
jgi:hypothetical protein